jgi:hypothetical protein
MIKIEGLDELTRDLEQAQQAMKEMDGELGTVNFDPEDPGSIEAAIVEVEKIIDQRLGSYASNSIVRQMADGLKEQYREEILQRAASARLQGGDIDGE